MRAPLVTGSADPLFGSRLAGYERRFTSCRSGLSRLWCSAASLAPQSSRRISISLSSLCGLGQRLIHSIASFVDLHAGERKGLGPLSRNARGDRGRMAGADLQAAAKVTALT
jgi:hypothetical protein